MESKKVDLGYFWNKKVILSFWLSVFVVAIHSSAFSQYIKTDSLIGDINGFINIFFRKNFALTAVPLFFIMSGVSFFREYSDALYISKIKSRIRTLLIPYFCWNLISMLFAIVTSYTSISNYFVGRPKFVLSAYNVFMSLFFYKNNGPFYYIFDLFVFSLFSPVINRIIKNKLVGISFIALLAILLHFNIGLPSFPFFAPTTIIYYLIGCLIGKHFLGAFTKKRSANESYVALVLLIISMAILLLKSYKLITYSETVSFVVIGIMALSFWVASDLFVNKVETKNYMKYSFMVYAMHVNVQAVLVKIFYLAFPKNEIFASINFFVTTVLTVLCINLACVILKKYLRPLYSVLSGER